MGIPYMPKDFEQLADLLLDWNTRLDNLEGVIGTGLSHNDLKDIEDHEQFLKADGSVNMNAPLNMAGQAIIGASNDIMTANVRAGEVKVNKDTNTLTYDASGISTNISTADSKAESAATAVASNSTNISSNSTYITNVSTITSANKLRLDAAGL